MGTDGHHGSVLLASDVITWDLSTVKCQLAHPRPVSHAAARGSGSVLERPSCHHRGPSRSVASSCFKYAVSRASTYHIRAESDVDKNLERVFIFNFFIENACKLQSEVRTQPF